VDCLDAPCCAVLCLANDLAKESRRVIVADLTENASLFVRLVASRSGSRGRSVRRHGSWPDASGEIRLVAPSTDDLDATALWRWLNPVTCETGQADERELRRSGDVVIVVASIDAMTGGDRIRRWSRDAIVTVTAGSSTGVRLRAAGELLKAADVEIRATVLLGADETDDSSGVAVTRAIATARPPIQLERDRV
jgi:hypothetical protein